MRTHNDHVASISTCYTQGSRKPWQPMWIVDITIQERTSAVVTRYTSVTSPSFADHFDGVSWADGWKQEFIGGALLQKWHPIAGPEEGPWGFAGRCDSGVPRGCCQCPWSRGHCWWGTRPLSEGRLFSGRWMFFFSSSWEAPFGISARVRAMGYMLLITGTISEVGAGGVWTKGAGPARDSWWRYWWPGPSLVWIISLSFVHVARIIADIKAVALLTYNKGKKRWQRNTTKAQSFRMIFWSLEKWGRTAACLKHSAQAKWSCTVLKSHGTVVDSTCLDSQNNFETSRQRESEMSLSLGYNVSCSHCSCQRGTLEKSKRTLGGFRRGAGRCQCRDWGLLHLYC